MVFKKRLYIRNTLLGLGLEASKTEGVEAGKALGIGEVILTNPTFGYLGYYRTENANNESGTGKARNINDKTRRKDTLRLCLARFEGGYNLIFCLLVPFSFLKSLGFLGFLESLSFLFSLLSPSFLLFSFLLFFLLFSQCFTVKFSKNTNLNQIITKGRGKEEHEQLTS